MPMASTHSPFLDPGPASTPNTLALLQLKRDLLIPTILSSDPPTSTDDYAEGKVTNTRFGSFPHSTLLHQPWGTQILASVVDTGSRGSRKRKRRGGDHDTPDMDGEEFKGTVAKAETASSGFVHLIPPTPESWTMSLPHRTQVVYTPDYSYILQRLRARPGDHIIEAGAGSGSFTHAAVRAVFNGYPGEEEQAGARPKKKRKRYGRVFSYEFHKPRAEQLSEEIRDHGLDSTVRITNRDVYADGFNLPASESSTEPSSFEPSADVVFLDLPAPWLALKHLSRTRPTAAAIKSVSSPSDTTEPPPPTSDDRPFHSPLNPNNTTRLCTFSPCIEQVTRTVSTLRALGWLEISMVEILHKRLDVRRERVGLQEEGLRGANASAATVNEAVQRLRDVEGRAKAFHELQVAEQTELMRKAEAQKRAAARQQDTTMKDEGGASIPEAQQHKVKKEKGKGKDKKKPDSEGLPPSKHDRLERAKTGLNGRDLFKEGRLLHRTEPEIKTHTSYLVFAVLPRAWSKEDEEKATKKWS